MLMVSSPPAEILEELVQLRHFVFNSLPEADVSLPATLQNVGYHPSRPYVERDMYVRFVVAALGASANVHLVTATRTASPDQLAALDIACRDRDIEFVVCETPGSYWRPLVHIDWI
ncbi:hypothetical protein FA95DRAFT_1610854 [Auriscalpium vulgare]|uniref:Uncharacterized protein n=1 Tax=Auriscalpium vulgare TaxID=40419 RepID=A0ACB8RCQ6_9AGAM|nr:hypothetical protein FA95DRAFT_1610854 [Auriscalpium vulgare]